MLFPGRWGRKTRRHPQGLGPEWEGSDNTTSFPSGFIKPPGKDVTSETVDL
jgi:hypothetical protein